MRAAQTSLCRQPPGGNVAQREKQIEALENDWAQNARWKGVKRGYSAADVVRLRGSVTVEHTLAKRGAQKLWQLMHERPFVNSLGALTGNQAVQQVKAGVHFEDQLASVKKCGHMGGKVLVPTQEAVQKLVAARLAADVAGVPTVLLARTDAEAATLVTSDVDENDKPFVTGERTAEGFYRVRNGLDQAIARGVAYAAYADMVWCETGKPDLDFARKFAEAVQKAHPGKMLAYNCSPSFNWKRNLDDATIARFQRELGAMGYKFQFITLAGFHALNYSMFELAYGYARNNMSAFVELQQKEFAAAEKGFTAVKHQREVGTSYFDEITQVVTGGTASTTALHGSTEDEQFFDDKKKAKLAAV